MDSLQAMAQRGMEEREKEVLRCEALIAAQVEEFAEWVRQRVESGPPRVAAKS
jgi:glutamyl-tRNA reductase